MFLLWTVVDWSSSKSQTSPLAQCCLVLLQQCGICTQYCPWSSNPVINIIVYLVHIRTYGKHVEPYVDSHLTEFRVSFTVSFFQNLRPGYKRPVRVTEMFTSVPCPVSSTRALCRCPGDSTELAFIAGARSVKCLHGRLPGVSCSGYCGTAAERHQTGELERTQARQECCRLWAARAVIFCTATPSICRWCYRILLSLHTPLEAIYASSFPLTQPRTLMSVSLFQ